MTRGLVVSIHDVAPSTLEEAARWREIVSGLSPGPVSLLLVPRYRGHDSWRSGPARAWARERAAGGDEIVLHGYTHLRRGGGNGAELAGRPPGGVRSLIAEGARELRIAGLEPGGFIAPAYAHPASADGGCRAAGLRWWATRGALRSDAGRRPLPSLGLGASTGLRRALSPAVARGAVAALAGAPVVRLDLHPADLHHRRLARSGRDLLNRLLDQDRRPITHAELWPPPCPVTRGRGTRDRAGGDARPW